MEFSDLTVCKSFLIYDFIFRTIEKRVIQHSGIFCWYPIDNRELRFKTNMLKNTVYLVLTCGYISLGTKINRIEKRTQQVFLPQYLYKMSVTKSFRFEPV